MPLNDKPCATCRNLQSESGADNPLVADIREANTVLRGGERFFVCPDCEKLYAVKQVEEGPNARYALVSAASVNRHYQWMVDGADGRRERAKGSMTEEEARRKYSNPEKIIHRPIYQPPQ
jgi:hypothetical protein